MVFEKCITHAEARDAAQAFIDEHFSNRDSCVQTRIPADETDHDIVLTKYIRQQEQNEGLRLAQDMLLQFHDKFGCVINHNPTMVDRETLALRVSLINEECLEFESGANKPSIVEMADAIGDIIYVAIGSAVSLGIDIWPVFQEIHRSNMSKVWADGSVHYNELKKVLKPPSYSKADVAGELLKQAPKDSTFSTKNANRPDNATE
jgi:predicted HAD superfamily Cof-like phosphohydrolase